MGTVKLRHRAGVYSVVIAVVLAIITPMPSPVIMRIMISRIIDCGKKPVISIAKPVTTAPINIILRRPNLSQKGAIKVAPSVMPTSAALKIKPLFSGSIDHASDTVEATTDIETISNPSSILRIKQITITAYCPKDMGLLSILSEIIFALIMSHLSYIVLYYPIFHISLF